MTVKELVIKVCKIINEKEIAQKLNQENVEYEEREEEIISSLVNSFNFVQSELAENYIPYFFTESIEDSNVINFDELSKRIISVYQIRDKFNRNVKYKIFPTYLKAERKVKSITYSYIPEELSLEDEIENKIIPDMIYVYGMVSEYYLIESMSTEADIYEERYKESILNFARKKSHSMVPSRRWI